MNNFPQPPQMMMNRPPMQPQMMPQPGYMMPQMPQPGMDFPQYDPAYSMDYGYQDQGFGLDARLNRLEREIAEINRRMNNLSRRVRRIEDYLNIRDE